MAAVCRYNHDIADYVSAAAAPGAAAEGLVGMLIKQIHEPVVEPARTVVSEESKAVAPAAFNEPAADGTVSLLRQHAAPVARPQEPVLSPSPVVPLEAVPDSNASPAPSYAVPPAINPMPTPAVRNQPTRAVRPKPAVTTDSSAAQPDLPAAN